MAQRTDGQLTTEANIIRDETAVGANTALRVGTMLDNLIDSKINIDKVSDSTSLGNSTTLIPTQNAVKTYVDANVVGLLTDNGSYDPTITSEYPTSGNTLSGGAVQKGDIWFISADGTMNGNAVYVGYSVRALINNAGATTDADWSISNVGIGYEPENVAHKSFDPGMGDSDVYYPSQKAVRDYVVNQIALSVPTYPLENSNNKIQDISLDPNSSIKYPSNAAVSNFVAANITTPSLQDVVAVNPQATDSFGCTHPTDAAINVTAGDSSQVTIEAATGAGGYVFITNENGQTSSIRATNLTAYRTHQLPDASGILALQGSGWGLAGNLGTTPGTDFIGTTDAKDFIIKTNNTQRAVIGSSGDITVLNNFTAMNPSGNSIFCTDGIYSYASLISDPTTSDGGYLYLQNNIGVATSLKVTNLTSARTHQLPDADGTIALVNTSAFTGTRVINSETYTWQNGILISIV